MAKNIIEYYKQTAIYHVRYASENDVLYNNSDENKYVNFTYSSVTYAIRNSAIYYDGSAVYFTLISENPNTIYHQYEENNEWHTGSTFPLDQNSNGVYYKTFYKNGNIIYNFSISSSTLDHIVGYDIPYFTDLDSYTAYITNVINDWKNVDWELMDPIKLPSTMQDDYVINYNYDIPIQSGQSWEGFKSYVIPGTMIPVTFGPFVTINFKYGSLIYGADGYGYIAIRDNDGNVISEIRGLLFWLSTTELYLIAGVNEKNKEGRIGLYLRPQSGYGSSVSFNSKSKNRQAYEFITQNLLGATVNVNYYIPDGTYQYAKITYKQNTSPIDQNDGDSVDIDPTLSSINIKGLEEEKTYWFVIFTDKSESEAFPYTVEVDPVPSEYKTYINNINGTGFDWIKNLQSEEVSATFTDHITLTGLNMNFSPGSRTWYTNSHTGTDMEYWNKTTFSYITSALFVSTTGIDSVNITGSNDSYTCTINKNNSDVEIYNNNGMFVYDKNMSMGITSTNGIPRKWFANFNFNQNYLYYGNCNPFYNGSWATRTFTGTLSQVFENLQRYARNIDIYVNNELWSKAGK